MTKSPITQATVSIDDEHNLGVKNNTPSGSVRRVPLLSTSVNIDEDGNIGVFGAGAGTGGGVPEAPADGKQYGRQNKQWTEVENTGNSLPGGITIDGVAPISQGIDPENPVSGSFPDEVPLFH